MKKILLVLILAGLCFSSAFAETRVPPTIKGFNTSQLVKRGDVKVYSISFIATTANGSFSLHDVILGSSISVADGTTTIKAEGKEGVVGNSKFYDFSDKPLEFSNGLFLLINTGDIVIAYD